ncbi:phage tail assembly protein [Gorillibacterium timonense]|uniref:phage tail assembly protein n=1 Tax=Gorillibacterium timonense TaxID=1689269 RepID=UPI00071D760C|nr:phage tail assembly protein [Gorillibacterium timonense]
MNNETQTSVTYTLLRPIQFEGETVTELTLDFEKLTGADLLSCAAQARFIAPEEGSFVKALSMPYQITVTAKAAGVIPELIKSLKAKDFTSLLQRAQNFLLLQE